MVFVICMRWDAEVLLLGCSKKEKSKYKMFWVENYKRIGSVGILLVKKWVEAVFDVKNVLDRIMFIKIIVGKNMGFVKSIMKYLGL